MSTLNNTDSTHRTSTLNPDLPYYRLHFKRFPLYLSFQKRRSLRDTSLRFSGRNLSSSSFDGKAMIQAAAATSYGADMGERWQGTFLTAEF